MSTNIRTSNTATQIGSNSRVVGETKAQAEAKAAAKLGAKGDREGTKTEDPSDALALLALHADQNEGGLPPNGTFSLWQMLMAIMKYEKNNLDNNAEMQKNYAENLGGANGIMSKLFNVGCLVGEHDAQSLKDDAYGKFAQAGISGASIGVSAVKYFGNGNSITGESTSNGIKAGNATTANATSMEKEINESDAAIAIKENPAVKPVATPVDANVQARVDGWADGSHPIDNFKGLDENGNVDPVQAKLNEDAAAHVANDPAKRAEIQKRIDKQKEAGQAQISNADQKFNTFQNLNSTVTQGLNQLTSGAAETAQADETLKKAQANAAQTVMSQAQQGITAAENTAEKNAQDALQQANQWAAGFASAASSQVHA